MLRLGELDFQEAQCEGGERKLNKGTEAKNRGGKKKAVGLFGDIR